MYEMASLQNIDEISLQKIGTFVKYLGPSNLAALFQTFKYISQYLRPQKSSEEGSCHLEIAEFSTYNLQFLSNC
jgi:hypothetical protein